MNFENMIESIKKEDIENGYTEGYLSGFVINAFFWELLKEKRPDLIEKNKKNNLADLELKFNEAYKNIPREILYNSDINKNLAYKIATIHKNYSLEIINHYDLSKQIKSKKEKIKRIKNKPLGEFIITMGKDGLILHKYKYKWSRYCRSGCIKSYNKYKALKDNKSLAMKDNWTLRFKKEENILKHIEYKSLADIKSSYREKLLQLNNEFKEYNFLDTPIKRNEILAYIQKNLKI